MDQVLHKETQRNGRVRDWSGKSSLQKVKHLSFGRAKARSTAGAFLMRKSSWGKRGFQKMVVSRRTPKHSSQDTQSGLGHRTLHRNRSQHPCHFGSRGEKIRENDKFPSGDDRNERREISRLHVRRIKLGPECQGCRGKSQTCTRSFRASPLGRGRDRTESTHLEGVPATRTRGATAHTGKQRCAGLRV